MPMEAAPASHSPISEENHAENGVNQAQPASDIEANPANEEGDDAKVSEAAELAQVAAAELVPADAAQASLEAETATAPVPPIAALVDGPVPDISTLTAARDAAAFVAQIFADPSLSDAASNEVTVVEPLAPQEPEAELPPVPVRWPAGS